MQTIDVIYSFLGHINESEMKQVKSMLVTILLDPIFPKYYPFNM